MAEPHPAGRLQQEIHVWRVSLVQPQNMVDRLEQLLDPEEKKRAARFHFPEDRIRYTVSHGALRTILARYSSQAPADLRFRRGRFGKPCLSFPHEGSGGSRAAGRRESGGAPAPAPPGLHFNLSHCRDLAVIAVSSERLVGADVETVRDVGNLDSVVERYFSLEEKRFLASSEPGEQTRALLALWSRREAAAKALGLDLSTALGIVKLPVVPTGAPAEAPRLAEVETDAGEKRPIWIIRNLELDEGHVGALCHEGRQIPVVYRDFQG
jgi:4'-phosphopantetheinyl transferase